MTGTAMPSTSRSDGIAEVIVVAVTALICLGLIWLLILPAGGWCGTDGADAACVEPGTRSAATWSGVIGVVAVLAGTGLAIGRRLSRVARRAAVFGVVLVFVIAMDRVADGATVF